MQVKSGLAPRHLQFDAQDELPVQIWLRLLIVSWTAFLRKR